MEVGYRWDPGEFPVDAYFAPEMSLSAEVDLVWGSEPEDVWRQEIRTVSKSEEGSEESVQGLSLTPRWPVTLGQCTFTIRG